MLTVKNGSIYDEDGRIFDDIAIVLDKNEGLLKWGYKDEPTLKNWYMKALKMYNSNPTVFNPEDLVYIELDMYDNFSIEEICTLLNWLRQGGLRSAPYKLMMSDREVIKQKIKELKEFGY